VTTTGVLTGVDELTAVAVEIRREHEAVCQATRSRLEHARIAGELLTTVKNTFRHGEWSPCCPPAGGHSWRRCSVRYRVSAMRDILAALTGVEQIDAGWVVQRVWSWIRHA